MSQDTNFAPDCSSVNEVTKHPEPWICVDARDVKIDLRIVTETNFMTSFKALLQSTCARYNNIRQLTYVMNLCDFVTPRKKITWILLPILFTYRAVVP
jgi:hypothetical protein